MNCKIENDEKLSDKHEKNDTDNLKLELSYEQIKSKERVNNHGEVFTPTWLAKDMLDLIPASASKINSRYLEASAGEGIFLVEVLRRKLDKIKKMYNNKKDIEFYILVAVSNIYGLEILKDNVEITKKRLETLVQEFLNEQKINSTEDNFLEIVKFILNLNIINIDSIKLKRPMFDNTNKIIKDSSGNIIYDEEDVCISEWEFDETEKKVKRIEYYYKDVVEYQKQEYLKKQEDELIEKENQTQEDNQLEVEEKTSQMDLFNTMGIYEDSDIEEAKELIPLKEYDSVYYLNMII